LKQTPATIIALTALVAALAGTAWAAGLERNSVKSKQIKDNSIQSADVQDGGIAAVDLDPSLSSSLESAGAAQTLSAHRLFPADGNPADLISVPGIALLTGSCGATSGSVGYRNASAGEQRVSLVVNPAVSGTGSGGGETTGPFKPDGVAVLGVLKGTSVVGRARVAASTGYLDADVFIGHPSGDSGTCEAFVTVTVTHDLAG
jgi:hypothetical protein